MGVSSESGVSGLMKPATTRPRKKESATMSMSTEVKTAAAPYDDETADVNVRRTFKTTEENKTRQVSVSMKPKDAEKIRMNAYRSARWRSEGQFLNDAIIYYLNGEGGQTSYGEIMKGAEWTSEDRLVGAITSTLFEEIDMMVNQPHTPWTTKQEFYICAIKNYAENGYPVMLNLR